MTPDLAATLGTVESPTLEFKREVRDRNAMREAICALANDLVGAGGGDLLIGVDKNGHPVPVDVSDDALLSIAQMRDEGRILERPSITVDGATFAGEPVIRVHVNASGAPPVRFDGVAWVRPGPLTKRASAEDERILTERRVAAVLPFDSQSLQGSRLDDLDLELLRSTYVAAAVDPDVLEENGRPLVQQLASLRIVDPAGTPTVLGMLLGGLDPTTWLPGAYVQFVRYEGTGADSDVRDEEEIRDNLITTARTLSSLLQAYIGRRPAQVDSLTERTVTDYPVPAIREAINNALTHRAYQGSHAPCRILWFEDRVEVSNPGGPFGIVTPDNFGRVNDYRNPALAAAMKTLGYVNRSGRGIERIRGSMLRNGNPPPEFDVDRSSWSVTLRRAP